MSSPGAPEWKLDSSLSSGALQYSDAISINPSLLLSMLSEHCAASAPGLISEAINARNAQAIPWYRFEPCEFFTSSPVGGASRRGSLVSATGGYDVTPGDKVLTLVGEAWATVVTAAFGELICSRATCMTTERHKKAAGTAPCRSYHLSNFVGSILVLG